MFPVGASEAKSPHAGLYIGEKQASANDEARRFQANLAEASAVAGRCGQFAVTILERLRVGLTSNSTLSARRYASSLVSLCKRRRALHPSSSGKVLGQKPVVPAALFLMSAASRLQDGRSIEVERDEERSLAAIYDLGT